MKRRLVVVTSKLRARGASKSLRMAPARGVPSFQTMGSDIIALCSVVGPVRKRNSLPSALQRRPSILVAIEAISRSPGGNGAGSSGIARTNIWKGDGPTTYVNHRPSGDRANPEAARTWEMSAGRALPPGRESKDVSFLPPPAALRATTFPFALMFRTMVPALPGIARGWIPHPARQPAVRSPRSPGLRGGYKEYDHRASRLPQRGRVSPAIGSLAPASPLTQISYLPEFLLTNITRFRPAKAADFPSFPAHPVFRQACRPHRNSAVASIQFGLACRPNNPVRRS